jgi:hypothetical protein
MKILFVWNCTKVDLEDQPVWICNEVPLLLQMEKELEDEVYLPNLGNTIKLLLRRTLVLSYHYSAI